MKKQNLEYEDESNGTGIVDTNTEEFKLFHEKIAEMSRNQSKEQKLRNMLSAIKFNMEDYIRNNNPKHIILVGDFLKQILETLNIQSKTFAQYLNLKPSNFSALIKGQRKLNAELAIKLGFTFDISPNIWVSIETKNEVIKTIEQKSKELQKYKIKNLESLTELK